LYARPEVVDGSEYWVIHKVHLNFECQPKPDNKSRSYTTTQLTEWGVIPTVAAYVPSSAGGKNGGGQVTQFGTMILKADKVQLKRDQLLKMLQKKKCNSTEHAIQQFALLDSYLESDLQNEIEARERRLAGYVCYTHRIHNLFLFHFPSAPIPFSHCNKAYNYTTSTATYRCIRMQIQMV
jgi:hypothetical protein